MTVTNSAIFYTGIENSTENPETGNTDIGGIVGIIRQLNNDEEYAEESFDSVDYISEKLGVFWIPSEYWCYSADFEVQFREYDSDDVKTIKVSGFMNDDGTLKPISDSCYDELRTRYPDFDIRINGKNAVVLYLSNREEGMPYLNRVKVVFKPTMAVRNLTEISLGGYVKLSEGGYDPEYVGRLAGVTEAAALADEGYYIDIPEIRIGRPAETGTLINADSSGRFNISLGEQRARTASLNVTGSIAVLRSDSLGRPVEMTVAIDKVNVPLDVGIVFAKAPAETTLPPRNDCFRIGGNYFRSNGNDRNFFRNNGNVLRNNGNIFRNDRNYHCLRNGGNHFREHRNDLRSSGNNYRSTLRNDSCTNGNKQTP